MSSKHSFKVGITRLRVDPGSVVTFEISGSMPDLTVSSSRTDDHESIELKGTIESVHGGLLVTGEIFTRWKGECRRCLGPASGELRIPLRELYERVEHNAGLASEGDTYPYSGDFVDFEEMVKDQVLLELPLAPLCKLGCKGLCANCGSDLNIGECDCDGEMLDPRWSALDILADKRR